MKKLFALVMALLLAAGALTICAAAEELVETFRQSSILIQSNPTKTEFYSPAN